jgi:hypothetical protein
VLVNLASASHSANASLISDAEGVPEFAVFGPARIEAGFHTSAPGRYELWIGGAVDRPLHVLLDHRLIAAPTEQFGGDASKYIAAIVNVPAGKHDLQLVRGGGSLRPGDDAATVIDGVVLEPIAATHERVLSVAPSAWHSLCGRQLDWLEAS